MRGRSVAVVVCAIAIACGDDGSGSSGTDAQAATSNESRTTTTASGTSTGDTSGSAGTVTGPATSGGTTTVDPSSTGQPETTGPPPGDPGSLRFFGNGGLYDDRVLIPIDDPDTDAPGPPVDVGADDFTIEFWIRPDPDGNSNSAISCGNNNEWVTTNIIVDRDRHSQPPTYGIGIGGGVLVFAVQGPGGDPWTLCGQTDVLDDAWHHVATQRRRSDGMMWLYVDGELDAMVDGPDGDVSYPDDGVPMDVCPGGLCDYSDPFLSLGAEKHGYGGISYAGYFDELRVSTVLRYDGSYALPSGPWSADADTVGLYHFAEGMGATVADDSAAPTHGTIMYGGDPPGPEWAAESPF